MQFVNKYVIIKSTSGERWGQVAQCGWHVALLLYKWLAMLIGEYQHNIDTKGRVIVPVRFREDLGDHFYITKGLDGCLFVLSQEEWARLQDKVKAMPISKARGLQRFFFSGAAEAEPDKPHLNSAGTARPRASLKGCNLYRCFQPGGDLGYRPLERIQFQFNRGKHSRSNGYA